MSSLPPINLRTNTVDAVADQLRRELVAGAITPGERLLPKELAKRFYVSHIPIREALRRLEAEGLVVAYPHGATYAAEVGIADLDGIYELRFIVEGEFAARSARTRTAGDLDEVRRRWTALEATDSNYSEEFFLAHRQFHWSLLAPAGSRVTELVLDRLWRSTDRYLSIAVTRLADFYAAFHADGSHQEHLSLLAAFEAGDGDLLRSRLITHLANTRDRLRRTYLAAISANAMVWLDADGRDDASRHR
jgi:DNA-binding GntR family transcriptional regulator